MGEFLADHPHRGTIQQRCAMIDKAAHTLSLMSQRQRMTVTELRAQMTILQTWLREIEQHLATAPDPETEPG